MQALIYYLLYPFIFLISSSPFWLLYGLSNIVYVIIYYGVGYRKKVVLENLKKSYPDKTDEEINKICKDSYKYLCDLMVETLKTTRWNEADVRKHTKMNNVELLNKFYEEGKSVILVMGHLGNWEWAGPCFSLSCKHQLNVIYQPLSNVYFEKMLVASRTKFNTNITTRKNVLRNMIATKKELTAIALIADQAPTPVRTALWMDFMNQETAVFNGPEKISKTFNYPVVYMHINRMRRGFYEVTPTLLFEDPKSTEDTEITRIFNKKLEEDILKQPATWLWSHKRWKHKKKDHVDA